MLASATHLIACRWHSTLLLLLLSVPAGLRDAIKEYSQWPTIPQLYVGGEFVGGSDIVEQMVGNGELQLMLRGESK
jgi:glutaredoxin-related protein